jgi:hypothetical protein
MKPEIRAKKDKCTLVASVDHGKLRVLGVSDDPLIILKGQVCEPREAGRQVVVVQRHAVRDAPMPPAPHGNSATDFAEDGELRATGVSVVGPPRYFEG